MACRCSEIQNCAQDIATLKTLEQLLNASQDVARSWTLKMFELSQELSRVAFVANMTKIEMRLASIKQNQNKKAINSVTKNTGELTRIRRKQDNYEYEDKRHHEKTGVY